MVHRPIHAGDRPDLALLKQVLDGLQTIWQGLRTGLADMVEPHRLPALAQDACTYAVMRSPTAEPLHGRPMCTGGDEYRLQKPWSELMSWAREE